MVTSALTPLASDTAGRVPPGSRIYAIGDVHGHSDKLVAMHAAIRSDMARRPVGRPLVVHLGDLIDRGPDSAGCVAMLADHPPFPGVPTINLMGNHESMMLTALVRLSPGAIEPWLDNGGSVTLESWGIPPDTPPAEWPERVPKAHLMFLRDLALSHTAGNYLFVHAGVRPGVALVDQRKADLLWIRGGFLDWDGVMLPEDPSRMIVHGHTPDDRPIVRANRIGIDTGSGRGGPLTCLVLEGDDMRFIET